MARPKRIYERTGKPYRTDRELVYDCQHCRQAKKKLAMEELWDKYFLLRMKMKHSLEALCRRNNIYMPEIFDEYDSECWIKFVEQMDGVRLEEVEHIKNWSIYIRLWGYWRSMNRDLLKHWFDWKKHTIPIYSLNSHDGKGDGESSITNLDVHEAGHLQDNIHQDLDKKVAQEIFWEGIEQLKNTISDKEYQLINLRYKGVKNSVIKDQLGITPKILKESLIKIQNQLKFIINDIAEQKGVNMNYDELCEVFQHE